MDFTELRHLAEQIETECGKAIIGKGEQIRLVLTSLFAGGHVLIDDIPGVGKTTLVKALSAVLGCGMVRVQFTPDLLPSDIVGMNIYSQKTGEMVFTPGPIMTNILLADEINRAIPRTQSALLEAMEERQVSVDGVTYPLAPPFMVLATQNPVETETTFALPAAQLDRFLFKLSMGYPTPREEAAMLRTVGDGAAFADLRPLLSPEEVNRFTREIRQVRLSDPVVAYIVELVQATREQPELACGASPRVSRDLFRASKAYAALSGRDYVTPDDVKYLARVCLQAAGYSLTADGTCAKSTDPELDKSVLYPIALQACKDVMDQEGKSVALKENFQDIFEDICRDVVKAGSESLWEIPYANEPTARGRMVYTFGLKHKNTDDMTGAAQGGQAGPTPFFYFDYSENDKRRDITCVPYVWDKEKQVANSINTWYFGKLRYEWMDRRASGNDDGINKVYMRYADIILMRAEIENELNGPEAAAPYLKKIRQRAFSEANWPKEVEQYVAAASVSKETMFNAIIDERAFEFCGEMIRRADLIRWNMLKKKLDEAKTKMYDLRSLSGEYDWLTGHLYTKPIDFKWKRNGVEYTLSKKALQFYGLQPGENKLDPSGYVEYTDSEGKTTTWIKEDNLKDDKIESLYLQDPDKYMYWPIFQYNLDANPALENYSWYGK